MNILKRNHVEQRGSGKQVLLYAHGFGCSQQMWARVAPAFDATHRQILFDYVGSGKSDISAFKPDRYASLQGYAQDMIDVCDALGLRGGVTLVAHSVSCSIGVLASIARPELFERLVLLGPSPCFVNHPPDYLGGFERADLQGLLELMDQNYMGWANYLAPVVAGESGAGAVASELSDSFCSTDPVVARSFAQVTFFSDNRADLARVKCPSLVLQHSHDALAPISVGEFVHANLAGSQFKLLDTAGHCAHLSNPELVVSAMQDYLAQPRV